MFAAHWRLNQEDFHRLEASVGYIVNSGQQIKDSQTLSPKKNKCFYYKITMKPTIILKTVTFKSIHFF